MKKIILLLFLGLLLIGCKSELQKAIEKNRIETEKLSKKLKQTYKEESEDYEYMKWCNDYAEKHGKTVKYTMGSKGRVVGTIVDK